MLFVVAEDCPRGTYNNRTGLGNSTECTLCDPGTYCPDTGLILPFADCAAGYYCELGSTEATPDGQVYGYKCPVGHYCEEGIRSPTPCPRGTYNPQEGRDSKTEGSVLNICSCCNFERRCRLHWACFAQCSDGPLI